MIPKLKQSIVLIGLFTASLSCFGQKSSELVFPDSAGWNVLHENHLLTFKLRANNADTQPNFSIAEAEGLKISFDSLGNFKWKPSFDLVDRIAKTKDFTVIFQASWADGTRVRKPITFTVYHVNRPPVIEELPVFYVKQATQNSYQISSDYVYDPDNDPLVFKAIGTKIPEGASLSSQGLITWNTSRSQFNFIKTNIYLIEFVVQDQPDKAETIGRLRVGPTQQDIPPEILIVPGDSLFVIKEDETLNLKIYISDPNGDDNVRNTSFIASDRRVPLTSLKENTLLQYEFTWTPGYNFVTEVQKQLNLDITFFALDKTNNRSERKIRIRVKDTENVAERDEQQYLKYRNNLSDALLLIQQLDEHQKKLNHDYKKAKRGKKQRSIINATFGATSGFSPLIFQPNQAKIVGGVGGTTVLTLGTLEAAEVIGKSRQDILDKIKTCIEIRNGIQSDGDEFARKYALKSARRNPEFEKDIDKLRAAMNDQKLVLLELDADEKAIKRSKVTNKDLKKVFLDFSEA